MKINQTGRSNTFDIATIGRVIKIGLQQFIFAVMLLEPKGITHLPELTADTGAIEVKTQPRQLHSQCGCALTTPTLYHALPEGPADSRNINTTVLIKPAIFI